MKGEWIDLQVNGYAGVNFNAEGLTVEAVKAENLHPTLAISTDR